MTRAQLASGISLAKAMNKRKIYDAWFAVILTRTRLNGRLWGIRTMSIKGRRWYGQAMGLVSSERTKARLRGLGDDRRLHPGVGHCLRLPVTGNNSHLFESYSGNLSRHSMVSEDSYHSGPEFAEFVPVKPGNRCCSCS